VQYQRSSWRHELVIAGEEIVEGDYALAGDLLLNYTALARSSYIGCDIRTFGRCIHHSNQISERRERDADFDPFNSLTAKCFWCEIADDT
jgi:hypothetical protein